MSTTANRALFELMFLKEVLDGMWDKEMLALIEANPSVTLGEACDTIKGLTLEDSLQKAGLCSSRRKKSRL